MVKKIAANAPACFAVMHSFRLVEVRSPSSNDKPFKMSSFESLTSSSLFTSCTTRPSSLH